MLNLKSLPLVFAVSIPFALSSGCSVKKQLDEMHDATVRLAEDSPKKDGTNVMANYLLKGDTARMRMEKLEAMDRAHSMRGKMSAAAAYYYSFEYQSWNAAIGATPELKSAMLHRMVEEYFNDIAEYRDRNDGTSATSKDNTREGLYALAAAMHRIDSDRERTPAEFFTTDPESVYSLVANTLIQYRAAYEAKQVNQNDLKLWQLKILQNETLAIQMLKIRANFLFASPLAVVAGMDSDRGFWRTIGLQGIADFFSGAWKKMIGGSDPQYNLSRAELEYESLKLEKALETRRALAQMGVQLEIDQDVYDIYENLREEENDMETKRADYFSKTMSSAKFQEVRHFRSLVDQWLNFDKK